MTLLDEECVDRAIRMMGAWALVHSSKQLVLNEEGVLCKSWIATELVPWGELEDYRLSYYGRTNKRLNAYHLYFSKRKLSIKNECSKRLRGKMIKVDIVGGYLSGRNGKKGRLRRCQPSSEADAGRHERSE